MVYFSRASSKTARISSRLERVRTKYSATLRPRCPWFASRMACVVSLMRPPTSGLAPRGLPCRVMTRARVPASSENEVAAPSPELSSTLHQDAVCRVPSTEPLPRPWPWQKLYSVSRTMRLFLARLVSSSMSGKFCR